MSAPDEDWYAIDVESKLNRKIDTLQAIVQQQNDLLQKLSQEMTVLKEELHRTHQTASHDLSRRHDRTHELLEELRISQQREMNMAIRAKIAVPFCSNKTLLAYGLGSKTIPLSPHFLGGRLDASASASASALTSMNRLSPSARSPNPFSL